MIDSIPKALFILELETGASRVEIKEAYRALVSVWHPDRFESNQKLRQKAEEKLRQINAAYELLTKSTSPSDETAPNSAAYENDQIFQQALAFEMGDGVEKDLQQAIALYQQSAEAGNPLAQLALANHYQQGQAIPRNISLAATWARLAAEKGFIEAQRFLGLLYLDGDGIAPNATEAVAWFQRAAEQDDAMSQMLLGMCLVEGDGCRKDEPRGIKWLLAAASQKLVDAYIMLGLVYANGRLPDDYEDPKKAKGFWAQFTEGYRQGASDLQLNGKRNYLELSMDLISAHKWLTLAAMANHPTAMRQVLDLESFMTHKQIETARSEFSKFLVQFNTR